MQFQNVPEEMRAFPQWILWRYGPADANGKPSKIPVDPNTGEAASVTDATTWGTFLQVIATYQNNPGGFAGIGFVFTEADPFTGIDLDNPGGDDKLFRAQLDIYNQLSSYTELSPSGLGVHIICKGRVQTARMKGVEIYSTGRYFTMTGNLYNGYAIIREQQHLLSELQISVSLLSARSEIIVTSGDMREADDAVLERCRTLGPLAAKFCDLWDGHWQQYNYPSASEADQALANIITFFTDNFEQAKRLYLAAPHVQRDAKKAKRSVEYTVKRAWDRKIPLVDLSAILPGNGAVGLTTAAPPVPMPAMPPPAPADSVTSPPQVQPTTQPGNGAAHTVGMATLEAAPDPVKQSATAACIPVPPPGLIHDVAQYIYSQMHYPVPEVATIGALAFAAGVCGSGYHVAGAGLNLYLLLVAPTGVGKDTIARSINRISRALAAPPPMTAKPGSVAIGGAMFPALKDTFVGSIASGQALNKIFTGDYLSRLAIQTEFATVLAQLVDKRANGAQQTLKGALLQFYERSGPHSATDSYTAADSTKNSAARQGAALSLFGDCTPKRLLDLLDENLVEDGFFNRFLCMESPIAEEDNELPEYLAAPSASLVERVAGIATSAFMHAQQREPKEVEFTKEARAMALEFKRSERRKLVRQIGSMSDLHARTYMHAIKIAALLAVGAHQTYPCITVDHMQWAIGFVERSTSWMQNKFRRGEVGAGAAQRSEQVRSVLKHYLITPYDQLVATCRERCSREQHTAGIVTHRFLWSRFGNLPKWKDNTGSCKRFYDETISLLVDEGVLEPIRQKVDPQTTSQTAKMWRVFWRGVEG